MPNGTAAPAGYHWEFSGEDSYLVKDAPAPVAAPAAPANPYAAASPPGYTYNPEVGLWYDSSGQPTATPTNSAGQQWVMTKNAQGVPTGGSWVTPGTGGGGGMFGGLGSVISSALDTSNLGSSVSNAVGGLASQVTSPNVLNDLATGAAVFGGELEWRRRAPGHPGEPGGGLGGAQCRFAGR